MTKRGFVETIPVATKVVKFNIVSGNGFEIHLNSLLNE